MPAALAQATDTHTEGEKISPSSSAHQSDEAQTTVTTLLDWDSPDDPGNPKNWSLTKRIVHTAIPGFFGFSVAFGTSVYAPGIPQIAERFGASIEVATLGVSLYSIGLALGPVIGAPISETRGRKAVYGLTLPVFLLFTIGCGLSKNITSLLICRFFAAAAGSPCLAIGGGTVADLGDMREGGGLAAILIVQTIFLGPTLGPLVGGYTLQTRGDWTWLMWVMLLTSGPLYFLLLFASETSKKEILRQRANVRGLPQPPKPPTLVALKMLIVITLFRPLEMLLIEPIVTFMALYCSFSFGVLYAFFFAYPYVFEGVYSFTVGSSGLPFLAIFIGTLLATLTFFIFDNTLYKKAKAKCPAGTMPAPEERLYTCMVGSFGIPVGLFWFAWTARTDVHSIVPIIAGVPFGWGMSTLFFSGICYLVDTYGALYGASAIAANAFARYIFGAAFPLFTLQMYERLGIAWATSLLGFLSLFMLPIPLILYRWGPTLRAKTSFHS
jgi:MFS family permease